jgi:carboxypeptidase Q
MTSRTLVRATRGRVFRFLLPMVVVPFASIAPPHAPPIAPPALHRADTEPVDLAMIARIREEGLERSEVFGTYLWMTEVIGPRLSGSPSYDEAAVWASGVLSDMGLARVHLEPFEFGAGWSMDGLTIAMTAPRFLPILGYPEAWTPPTAGVLEGRPVYLGDRSREEIIAMGPALRGAIVLAQRPQTIFTRADRPQPTDVDGPVRTGAPARAPGEGGTAEVSLNAMAALLQELGAGAMLTPTRGEHGTVFVLGNRNTPRDAVPSFKVAAEHYNTLVRMVEAGLPVRLRVGLEATYHDDRTESHNVIAEIPGSDPEIGHEVVLLGAHLDSWHTGTGAVDNADGVAVAMEAMRILQALPVAPRRTIRIALWGGEEQGLLGSRAHVERHYMGDANAAAHEAFSVYLNDDPGGGATFGWYMEENAEAMEIFDAWLEPLRDLGVRRNVIQGIPSTDHLSFTRAGLPGFTAIKDYRNYDTRIHHTNMDRAERIEEDDLKQAAVVLAVFAWHAAQRDARIPRAMLGDP